MTPRSKEGMMGRGLHSPFTWVVSGLTLSAIWLSSFIPSELVVSEWGYTPHRVHKAI